MDGAGEVVLREAPDTRRIAATTVHGEPTWAVAQSFDSPARRAPFRHRLFSGRRASISAQLPRRLTQVNTQISLPFILSSNGYGLMWHNRGLSRIQFRRAACACSAHSVDSAATRPMSRPPPAMPESSAATREFDGEIHCRAGRPARLPARYRPQDGVAPPCRNRWPAVYRFHQSLAAADHELFADLAAGDHTSGSGAMPTTDPPIAFGPVADRTVWRSPVAEAIDYVVIAGPGPTKSWRLSRSHSAPAPMLPIWAFGYIHCRERFNSSAEILDTLDEFRRAQAAGRCHGAGLAVLGQAWLERHALRRGPLSRSGGAGRRLHAQTARYAVGLVEDRSRNRTGQGIR